MSVEISNSMFTNTYTYLRHVKSHSENIHAIFVTEGSIGKIH